MDRFINKRPMEVWVMVFVFARSENMVHIMFSKVGRPQPANFVSGASEKGDEIVIRAHQAAKKAIKAVNPDIQVGITLSLHDAQWVDGGEEKAQKEWDSSGRRR